MNRKIIGLESVDKIDLTLAMEQWEAVVNRVMNIQVPQKGGEFLDCVSDC
jgi:hypothetical protein